MKAALAILLMAASAGAATLERPPREDTIYVLSGDVARLEAFAAGLQTWEGGQLIERDLEKGAFSFWAYSERTASQARQFLMPAAFSGLALEIRAYDQAASFPNLRAKADKIAIDCGIQIDPFFVSPVGGGQFRPSPETSYDRLACALKAAAADSEIKPKLEFVGNERVVGEDTE